MLKQKRDKMNKIWEHDHLHYNATPITIDDWDLLGNHLRGILLSDLKYVDDIEIRLQTQSLIQMRDYDIDDVRRHFGRKEMSQKLVDMMFKNDKKYKPSLSKEFLKSDGFNEFLKEILKESGIVFVEEKDEENPTEQPESPLVKSE